MATNWPPLLRRSDFSQPISRSRKCKLPRNCKSTSLFFGKRPQNFYFEGGRKASRKGCAPSKLRTTFVHQTFKGPYESCAPPKTSCLRLINFEIEGETESNKCLPRSALDSSDRILGHSGYGANSPTCHMMLGHSVKKILECGSGYLPVRGNDGISPSS